MLTAGVPTGDRERGLGAGRFTIDGTGTVGRHFGSGRVFVNAGLANSIFSNVAYQRPYISTGPAAHVSGGVEVRPARRLALGAGGFTVRPIGAQTLYSRVIEEPAGPPRNVAPGNLNGRGPNPAGRGRQPAVFETTTRTEVSAVDLRDHGPNGWAFVTLHPSMILHFAVAHSLPFQFTTARVGLSFDFGRMLTSGHR